MKILILSCNTGGGHNTAARALKEVFDSAGDECEIRDALSFGSQAASDLVCDSYVEMVKNNPKIFGKLYEMGGNYGENSSGLVRSPVYMMNMMYTKALRKYLIENKIDAVVCCHFFGAQAMTHILKHYHLDVPFYFVATDYFASPLLEETNPRCFFIASKDSAFTFTARGIPSEKLVPLGIPVSQRFVRKGNKEKAREELRKMDININQDDKVYLIMSGSMGFGDIIDIAHDIFAAGDKKTRIIAITGNNKEMLFQFLKEFAGEPRVHVVGFTDKVNVFMEASDLLLTKPGGLSSTEAIVKGIPIIHTSPIPGCESENVQFFAEHHMSLCANSPDDASRLALLLMNDELLKNQMLEAQKKYRGNNSAKAIAKYVKKDCLAFKESLNLEEDKIGTRKHMKERKAEKQSVQKKD